MAFYCGIDLGARTSHVCIIDEDVSVIVDKKEDMVERLHRQNHFRILRMALASIWRTRSRVILRKIQ